MFRTILYMSVFEKRFAKLETLVLFICLGCFQNKRIQLTKGTGENSSLKGLLKYRST